MHKKVITAGILSSLVWAGILGISLGVPQWVCAFLKTATFGLFDGAIGNMRNGFYYNIPNRDMPTVVFLVLFSIAFFLYFALSLRMPKEALKSATEKKTFFAVIFFAGLFRLILLPSIPVHENDIYRYIWDGKVALSGMNPYAYAPQEAEAKPQDKSEVIDFAKLKSLREANPVYFSRIGHRRVPTIYPPFAQAIFSLAAFIRKDSIPVMKGIFVTFDFMAVILIAKLLSYFNKNPSLAIIYGWSPLVLKEVANSGHYDSVAIFLMLAAVYFLFKGRHFAGALSFALAALAKFFPIVLLPLYRGRTKLRYYPMVILLFAAGYIPFFLWQNTGAANVFKGLLVYSEKWAYNGSIFVFFQSLLNAFKIEFLSGSFLPRLASGLIFTAALIFLSLKKSADKLSALYNSFVIIALLFLLSPVGDPWYFCWVIPFLCFFPYYSFIVLSWLLIFSYLSFSREFGMFSPGGLELPVLNMLQYTPFFVLLALETFIRKKRRVGFSYAWKQ